MESEAGSTSTTSLDNGLTCVLRLQDQPPLWRQRPGFQTLMQIVLEQQVSLASALNPIMDLGLARRPTDSVTELLVDSSQLTLIAFRKGTALDPYTTAISLHSHTCHSNEVLTAVSPYIARIPIVARLFHNETDAYQRRTGLSVDFSKGWWHPPLTPAAVIESEVLQIETVLECASIVSVTDHDRIDAVLELQESHGPELAPISFEWTVPLKLGFLHLGVHNLRSADAPYVFHDLAAYTCSSKRPDLAELSRLLVELNADPEVLVVLNHPLWDISDIGATNHFENVNRFVADHGDLIHAFELNGYRCQQENREVVELANTCQLPIVSGGDRHGRTPNSVLNLTNATSFGQFAREIRNEKRSVILLMPEYRRALVDRKLKTASDVLRTYPTHPAGRQRWNDRVTYERHGIVRPLAERWPTGGPFWVRATIMAFQLATSPAFLPLTGAVARFFQRIPWTRHVGQSHSPSTSQRRSQPIPLHARSRVNNSSLSSGQADHRARSLASRE